MIAEWRNGEIVIAWILIIIGVIALDQISKLLVVQFLDRETPFVVIEGIFRFKYSENRGAAFGSFENSRWVFMIASVIGIVGLCVYLFRFKPKSKLACVAISMIIGGGMGNMIDRIFRTGEIYKGEKVVVDFIDFYAFPKIWSAIFNVADSFVCVGAALLILWCLISTVNEAKAEKVKNTQETPDPTKPDKKSADNRDISNNDINDLDGVLCDGDKITGEVKKATEDDRNNEDNKCGECSSGSTGTADKESTEEKIKKIR